MNFSAWTRVLYLLSSGEIFAISPKAVHAALYQQINFAIGDGEQFAGALVAGFFSADSRLPDFRSTAAPAAESGSAGLHLADYCSAVILAAGSHFATDSPSADPRSAAAPGSGSR